MKNSTNHLGSENLIPIDLSLLSIEAAEQLTNLKSGIDTELDSFQALINILKTARSGNPDFRVDHAAIISSAFASSPVGDVVHRSISDLMEDALQVSGKSEDVIEGLISFFIALSDRASIYNDELEEL